MRGVLRFLGWATVLLLGVVALLWLSCETAVEIAAWGRCHSRLEDVPVREFGLVLGTSKFVAPGRINLHYQYRIDAAVELYRAGKVRRLIVSGNGADPHYNEPRMMREDLVARGVPDAAIVSDEAGLRTFDSVVRAAEVFGARRFTVVSQRSHNERAVFIGRARGLDVDGWDARQVGVWTDPRTALREQLARVLAVFDVINPGKRPTISTPPKALSSTPASG